MRTGDGTLVDLRRKVPGPATESTLTCDGGTDRGRYVVGPGTASPRTCDGTCPDLRRTDSRTKAGSKAGTGSKHGGRHGDSTKAGTEPARNGQKKQEMGRMLVKMIIFVV